MFESVYLKINGAIHLGYARQNGRRTALPRPEDAAARSSHEVSVQQNYAFVAMAMDKGDHQLIDVLDAIKTAAKECG
jgi:hypothetical protein